MSSRSANAVLERLKAEIRHIESARVGGIRTVLPFGIAAIDRHLPEGGLRQGALHEVIGGGGDLVHGAAAALFCAGIAARIDGPVLWCLTRRDLFAPGLAAAGLDAGRVIHVEAGNDAGVLLAMEEGLRHRGVGAVIGEVRRLPMAASRRLHLAAETSGVTALALHRWFKPGGIVAVEPSAGITRWQVAGVSGRAGAAAASGQHPAAGPAGLSAHLSARPAATPGLRRARWQITLERCRGATATTWIMEACDAQGRLAVPAELGDRPPAALRARAA